MQKLTTLVVLVSSFFIINTTYAAVEISDGTVEALYHLEDTADSSGNGLTLTNSGASFETGLLSNAAKLELNDVLSRADNANMSFADENMSMSAWIKFDTKDATYDGIITKWNGVDANAEYSIYRYPTDVIYWTVSNGSALTACTSTASFNTDDWFYFYVEHNKDTNTIGISINNEPLKTCAHSTGMNNGTNDFKLAQDQGTTNDFVGMIDDLAIIRNVLATTTRDAIYNSGNGDEICITEGCDDVATTTTSTAMTDYETFVSYQLIVAIIIIIGIGTYKLLA